MASGRLDWLCQRCLRELVAQPPGRPVWLLIFLAVLLTLSLYPVLKSLELHLYSALTGSYVPGHHSVLLINCPNEQVAKIIGRYFTSPDPTQVMNVLQKARDIMEKRLAASVNILPASFVMYLWKGEIQDATESLLLAKTRTSKVQELTDFVKSIHPYAVPEVLSFPVDQGYLPYLKRMDDAVPDG